MHTTGLDYLCIRIGVSKEHLLLISVCILFTLKSISVLKHAKTFKCQGN